MWRTTRYDMVLWGYPPHDAVTILPSFIDLLDQVTGQALAWHLENQPNRPIPTSPDGWAVLVEEERDPKDGSLSLFLDSPSGLTMGLTVDYPRVVRDFDTLSLGLDTEHLIGPQAMFNFDKLYTLFTQSIRLFRPFSAEVGDTELALTEVGKVYLSVDVTKVPDTIYWFNYFGQDMAERLGGLEKLRAAPADFVTTLEEPPGVVLILQHEPFDYHNPEHRRRLEEITQYLDLSRLHTLYPKRPKRR